MNMLRGWLILILLSAQISIICYIGMLMATATSAIAVVLWLFAFCILSAACLFATALMCQLLYRRRTPMPTLAQTISVMFPLPEQMKTCAQVA